MVCNIYLTAECDKTAARLLEKIISTGARALLFDDDESYLQHMDKYLWSFSTKSFIPHGVNDQNAAFHKVLLSSQIVQHNKAETLFVIKKAKLLKEATLSSFHKCCFLCDNENTMTDALKYLQSTSNIVNCYMEYKNTWITKDL